MLKNAEIFKMNFSSEFIEELSLSMGEISLGPGETLFN